jgi:hypothetical protein
VNTWKDNGDEVTTKLPGALVAAAHMTNLRTLKLAVGKETAAADTGAMEVIDSKLAGLLSPISGLQQLRDLELVTDGLGPAVVAAVGCMKQLTRLKLVDYWSTELLDLTSLSSMTRLEELQVCGALAPTPPAATARPFCLPSSLERLWLRDRDITTFWLQHLSGCPQLTQLECFAAKEGFSAVLEAAACHTPGLQKLKLSVLESPSEDDTPASVPRDALDTLTALQFMHIDSWCVRSAADWEALRCLRGLTCLKGALLCCVPPEGWKHTGLVELSVDLELPSPHGADRVLAALPALQRAEIGILPPLKPPAGGAGDGAMDANGPATLLRASPHLTDLHVVWNMSGPPQHVHSMLAAAGSSLRRLELEWSSGMLESGGLPDLSACTALTSLTFLDPPQPLMEDLGELLGVLRPLAGTLRVWKVETCSWRNVRAAIKVLQHVLPRLEVVVIPEAELDMEQLQRLRQGLRPGLMLIV